MLLDPEVDEGQLALVPGVLLGGADARRRGERESEAEVWHGAHATRAQEAVKASRQLALECVTWSAQFLQEPRHGRRAELLQTSPPLLPLFHFFVCPILILNLVGWIVHTVRHDPTSKFAMLGILVAVGLLALALSVRVMAVKLQDRLIRIEERLRLERLLPPDSRGRINELTVAQLVALRFASDAELPALAAKTLAGGFARPSDIKAAITQWRADNMRV